MKRTFLLIILLYTMHVMAQSSYQYGLFVSPLGSLPYRYLEPAKVVAGERYPVVLFLHGAGERGSDNELQLTHGAQMFLNPTVRDAYGAYVLFPQCPDGVLWNLEQWPEAFVESAFTHQVEPTVRMKLLVELVDSMRQLPMVDSTRVYVIGMSMGAMATYELCWRYPEKIAAAVTICGAADLKRLYRAAPVAFRIYHGDNDGVVSVENSRQIYRRLSAVGADVVYREFPGCTHGSWNPAFNDVDFFPWLFSQSK